MDVFITTLTGENTQNAVVDVSQPWYVLGGTHLCTKSKKTLSREDGYLLGGASLRTRIEWHTRRLCVCWFWDCLNAVVPATRLLGEWSWTVSDSPAAALFLLLWQWYIVMPILCSHYTFIMPVPELDILYENTPLFSILNITTPSFFCSPPTFLSLLSFGHRSRAMGQTVMEFFYRQSTAEWCMAPIFPAGATWAGRWMTVGSWDGVGWPWEPRARGHKKSEEEEKEEERKLLRGGERTEGEEGLLTLCFPLVSPSCSQNLASGPLGMKNDLMDRWADINAKSNSELNNITNACLKSEGVRGGDWQARRLNKRRLLSTLY